MKKTWGSIANHWPTDVFCLAFAVFVKNTKPTFKNWERHIKIQISGFSRKTDRAGNSRSAFRHDKDWLELMCGCLLQTRIHTMDGSIWIAMAACFKPLELLLSSEGTHLQLYLGASGDCQLNRSPWCDTATKSFTKSKIMEE